MKIKIDQNIYECLRDAETDNMFILKETDVDKITADLSNSTKVYILDDDNIITETRYSANFNSVTLNKNFYIDDEGNFQDAISIIYERITVDQRVTDLEDAIKGKVNTELLSLNEYKEYRIKESKQLLADYLAAHPVITTIHNNTAGTYSITEEKQNLLVSNYLSYQLEKVVNPSAVLTWNESGETCEVWTEEEFISLILLIKSTVYPLVSQQQSYEKDIMACTTKSELEELEFIYG